MHSPTIINHRAGVPHPTMPPWHADAIGAGLAKPDQRGNIQGDGWRLRRSGHANFPCHGGDAAGGRQCRLPVLSACLLRRTQVLCYFPCTPRAAALRQARVSGGNLQNCAPSAACGDAMTQESNVPLVSPPLRFHLPAPRIIPNEQEGVRAWRYGLPMRARG